MGRFEARLRQALEERWTGDVCVERGRWSGRVQLCDGHLMGASAEGEEGLAALELMTILLVDGQVTRQSESAINSAGRSLSPQALVDELDNWAGAHVELATLIAAAGAPQPVEGPDLDASAIETLVTTAQHDEMVAVLLEVDGRRTIDDIIADHAPLPVLRNLEALATLGLVVLHAPSGDTKAPFVESLERSARLPASRFGTLGAALVGSAAAALVALVLSGSEAAGGPAQGTPRMVSDLSRGAASVVRAPSFVLVRPLDEWQVPSRKSDAATGAQLPVGRPLELLATVIPVDDELHPPAERAQESATASPISTPEVARPIRSPDWLDAVGTRQMFTPVVASMLAAQPAVDPSLTLEAAEPIMEANVTPEVIEPSVEQAATAQVPEASARASAPDRAASATRTHTATPDAAPRSRRTAEATESMPTRVVENRQRAAPPTATAAPPPTSVPIVPTREPKPTRAPATVEVAPARAARTAVPAPTKPKAEPTSAPTRAPAPPTVTPAVSAVPTPESRPAQAKGKDDKTDSNGSGEKGGGSNKGSADTKGDGPSR